MNKASYRDLIQGQLAARHADIECGLAKCRGQEALVLQVGRILSESAWDYSVRMDYRFNVVFNVEYGKVAFQHQYSAIRQFLAAYFDVEEENSRLIVNQRLRPEYTVDIIFGDVP